jgi:hypothetical protein
VDFARRTYGAPPHASRNGDGLSTRDERGVQPARQHPGRRWGRRVAAERPAERIHRGYWPRTRCISQQFRDGTHSYQTGACTEYGAEVTTGFPAGDDGLATTGPEPNCFFTLFIACLGLIGLINHMVEKRKKEISIRKVLGATVSGILMLLSREYIRLIGISILISVPLAIYFTHLWLENYAYKVDVSWWLYAMPGLVIVGIALVLVVGKTFRAARQNPVDNLRYE